MELVEWVVFILVAAAIYKLMGPLRKKIEHRLYRFFRGNKAGPSRVVNITDYKKKD